MPVNSPTDGSGHERGQGAPRKGPAREVPEAEAPPLKGYMEDAHRQGPKPPKCLLSADQAVVPCEAGPLEPCPLHRPQDGHNCECGALFCAAHSRQTSATGRHDGQSLSAAPRVAREGGMAPDPSETDGTKRGHKRR